MSKAQRSEPRGDRRRQRTRSAIMAAGQRLFAARAAEGVTIDEIVAAADVAKGSFYNHFEDKERLGAAIVELVQGDCEFHIFVANREVTDPAARVARALCVMLRYAGEHPERLQALLSLSSRRLVSEAPLNVGVVADLEAGINSGHFAGMTVETGLLLIVGIINTTVLHAIVDASQTPVRLLAATTGAGLLRGLGVPASEAADLARAAAADLLGERRA